MPTKLDPAVTAFIDSQPAATRQHFSDLRAMIRAAYPRAEEGMYTGNTVQTFPCYTQDGKMVAAFSARAAGPMAYFCEYEVVAAHRAEIGSLASGKSCVVYKPTKKLDATALKALFAAMFKEAAAKRK